MDQVFNFSAGPAMLPVAVMQQAQQEYLNWQGLGTSVAEVSHRSAEFMQIAQQAEQDLRDLMAIPDNYKVLFTHGGGRGQFAAVPLNLSKPGDLSQHLVSGSWSKGAVTEARKYLSCEVVAQATKEDDLVTVPSQDEWQVSEDAAYFHYCPNETVDGVEINWVPQTGDVPLVADMSSNILSKPIDVSQFGVIYAGAQKNIGPSGLAVVIVRDDLLDRARFETPSILEYATLAKYDSMYNTPPTFAWYLAGLVFKWLKSQGGIESIAMLNKQKSDMLYTHIDNSDFYLNGVAPAYRSRMNVPFQLQNPELDSVFLQQAKEQNLLALKGHRSVGGMRASIYNAMPVDGVKALIAFMAEFERRYA